MSVKKTPIDIESILEYGIDRWYDEFDWPLSWQEFLKIEDKCKKVLNDHIEKYSDYADLILINYKVFIEYSNLIYAGYVLKKAKYEPLISKENPYFNNLYHKGIPDKPIIAFPVMDNKQSNFKRKKRFLKQYLKDNKFHLPFFFRKKEYIFNESRSSHTLEYLQRDKLGSIYSLSFFDIYNTKLNMKLNKTENIQIETLVKSIISGIHNVAKDFRVDLSIEQQDFLIKTTSNLFKKSLVALKNIQRGLNGRKLDLYVGCNNNHFSRIMSVAVRSAGGKVYGFTHGEPLIYDNDYKSWIDLSLNDYYFEYTDLLRDELKRVMKKYPPLNKKNCSVKSLKLKQFDNMFEKKESNISKEVKKVMLIGNIFREKSYSSATAIFSTMQLYTELSILKKLQLEGYVAIYKIHPENANLQLIMSAFPKNIKIITKRFEEVTNIVDAFCFYYTGSTTLSSAIVINKPIFWIDTKISVLTEGLNKLLQKRVINGISNE